MLLNSYKVRALNVLGVLDLWVFQLAKTTIDFKGRYRRIIKTSMHAFVVSLTENAFDTKDKGAKEKKKIKKNYFIQWTHESGGGGGGGNHSNESMLYIYITCVEHIQEMSKRERAHAQQLKWN